MAYALFSDLQQSSFIPGESGLETQLQCIKVFGSEEAAIAHAAELIRKHVSYPAYDPSEAVTDKEVLYEFQGCLGGMEKFHIYPVVD